MAPFSRPGLAAILTLSGGILACHKAAPPAIDPALASCIAPDAALLAGVDCARLRASPLYQKLPTAVTALIEPLRDATYLLIASNGRDYAIIARGNFREAPAGSTMLAPGIAIAGSPDAVRTATAMHRSRAAAPLALLDRAEALAAANSEIWIVANGSASFPLGGNAENVNRLLHTTQYATLAAHIAGAVELEVTGVCATADGARGLEGTLRAMISLAAGAEVRQPEIAAQLRGIRIAREDRTVRASLSAGSAGIDQLLRLF